MALAELGNFADVPAVELDWYSVDETISVTPRNQKRFDIQKDRAIEILQRAKDADRFHDQFLLLLQALAEWINVRSDKIVTSIVTIHDGKLAFVVVRSSPEYDEQFQDALAELDYAVAVDPDLDLISLKTLALPTIGGDALSSFLDDRLVLKYVHGSRSGSHSAGKQKS